ncbi:MAG: hypothetical protein JO086_08815 [Acidimicrobiia bacterium]|nr:hypothetical protein [Acidimicrobiia bacterium]
MRRRWPRVAVVLGAAALLVGSSTAVLAQTSDSGTPLGGYKLDARAQAVNVLYDSPLIPSPTHPVFDGSVPAAQSTTDTGPIGHALASIFWPGPLGGNFGSALQQLNQECTPVLPVPGLPPPACIPIPQQLKDHGQSFNDPVKAETFFPQAPQDADYKDIPGATINSHITDGGKKTTAFGALDGFGAPGVGVVGNMTAQTINTLTDTAGTTEAKSEADGVVLAGGMVTIGRVLSTAKLTTDGNTATADAHTTIDGLKIAGLSATVDDQGVHLAGQSNPLHKQINQVVAQALAKSGLTIKLVPTDNSINGATGSATAGALVVQYEDDKDQVLPGAIQNSFTISLGGATANVDSAQGFGSDNSEPPADAGTTNSGGGDNTAVAGLEIPPAGLGSIATPPSALPRSSRHAAAIVPFQPILNSFGLAWGLVLFAVIVALALGFGLRRVTDDVFAEAPAAATCPLEEQKR